MYVFEDPKSDRGNRIIEISSACSSVDECKSILDDDSISNDDNEDEMTDWDNNKNWQTRQTAADQKYTFKAYSYSKFLALPEKEELQ